MCYYDPEQTDISVVKDGGQGKVCSKMTYHFLSQEFYTRVGQTNNEMEGGYCNRSEHLRKWKGVKSIAQGNRMYRFRMVAYSQEKDEGVSICQYYLDK